MKGNRYEDNFAVSAAASPFIFGILVLLAILIIVRNIRIVPQAQTYVVERLGTYHATWQTGVHAKLPFVDRVVNVVTLKERVADFQPQAVITKDNVTMQIDTVLLYQILDPKLYKYGIEHPLLAIENLTATTLRNIIGDLELDETLTSRDLINTRMRVTLDEATDPWGIKVNRVELKNIVPPKEIQAAMERQMKAEREKRENVLRAEGEREAAILVAEGEKEAAILRADALREEAIREADGRAQAILMVQRASAEGLNMLKAVQADQPLLTLQAYETMAKVADGRLQRLLFRRIFRICGPAVSLKELVSDSSAADPSGRRCRRGMSGLKAVQPLTFCSVLSSKCNYCDFASFADREQMAVGHSASRLEIRRQSLAANRKFLSGNIHLFGGTPSIVPPDDVP